MLAVPVTASFAQAINVHRLDCTSNLQKSKRGRQQSLKSQKIVLTSGRGGNLQRLCPRGYKYPRDPPSAPPRSSSALFPPPLVRNPTLEALWKFHIFASEWLYHTFSLRRQMLTYLHGLVINGLCRLSPKLKHPIFALPVPTLARPGEYAIDKTMLDQFACEDFRFHLRNTF